MSRLLSRLAILSILPVFAATSAKAHHAMGGQLPATFAEGFISGLAHPVIGLDHLGFIVAAGLLAGVMGLSAWLPVAFVAASIAGVMLHVQLFNLPFAELVIALSVVAAGALLALGREKPVAGLWAGLFALAGVFHGYAYGESIVGAEPTQIAAYLAGLAVVQSVVGAGVAVIASGRAWTPASLVPRLAGAAAFGIGLSAVMAQVIPG
ncbi:HupE/UreJ family protein [Xanthobacter sp. AM11]|uniref:HupE/UreJ family protein n=1 Tax=Xanthobacter sp. AM11 TaxID=3380643 RepID=UPI0039BFA9F3